MSNQQRHLPGQLEPQSRRSFLQILGLAALGPSLVGFPSTAQARSPGSAETLEQNKAVPRKFVERINAHDVDGAMSLLASDFVNYDVPGKTADLEDTRAFFSGLVAGFPDGRYTVLDMIAEGDKTRWRYS